MYHAHEERRKFRKTGDFLGLGESSEDEDLDDYESDSDDPDSAKMFQSDLLVGFRNWMDRLCEGSLKRIRVEYWPEMNYTD